MLYKYLKTRGYYTLFYIQINNSKKKIVYLMNRVIADIDYVDYILL